jgi:hypothetical protein
MLLNRDMIIASLEDKLRAAQQGQQTPSGTHPHLLYDTPRDCGPHILLCAEVVPRVDEPIITSVQSTLLTYVLMPVYQRFTCLDTHTHAGANSTVVRSHMHSPQVSVRASPSRASSIAGSLSPGLPTSLNLGSPMRVHPSQLSADSSHVQSSVNLSSSHVQNTSNLSNSLSRETSPQVPRLNPIFHAAHAHACFENCPSAKHVMSTSHHHDVEIPQKSTCINKSQSLHHLSPLFRFPRHCTP